MLWANSSNATLQAYLSKKYIRRVIIRYLLRNANKHLSFGHIVALTDCCYQENKFIKNGLTASFGVYNSADWNQREVGKIRSVFVISVYSLYLLIYAREFYTNHSYWRTWIWIISYRLSKGSDPDEIHTSKYWMAFSHLRNIPPIIPAVSKTFLATSRITVLYKHHRKKQTR